MRRVAQRYPGIPQVLMTAHDIAHAPVEPQSIFRKPFETAALLDQIERLFDQRARA
jgi:hypothetical protein